MSETEPPTASRNSPTIEDLHKENEDLRQRLEDAESTIQAISSGEVDAFLVRRNAEDHVLVLGGVDRPYRLLIERMQQGAATLTADATVFYVNQRLADLLEVPLGALIGSRLTDFVAEADRAELTDALALALTEDVYREVSIRRGDEVFPAGVTASPLLVHENMICVLLTDLTERKRQEEERERFLAEQVARVAAESTAAALREADRRKDEFLAILAHELRNPLGPLRNGIHLLGLAGPLEPLAQETREMMARQIENLVRLVDDLLDVGRVTRGMIKLRKEPIDARLVIERAVESCRDFVDQRGHRLDIDLRPYPLPIEVDLLRMTQVVVNLLKNAAKFTPSAGWIRITAERAAGSSAAIRVRDNGRGIEPKILAVIFDLFVQADSTAARCEEGLGIGLTLSRRLTELHGGTLEATSDGLGQGSEFVIRIPLADPSKPATEDLPAKKVMADTPRPAGRRVLIVDDNRDAAGSLGLLLRLIGHDVREANDGPKAIVAASEFHPEIIFLDIGLPGMDGYQVATRLRSNPELSDVRVIALSGYGTDQDRARSRAAGFDDHLVKPAEIGMLESILSS
ncbi:MAG TPA: ATP-binding protein [Thermoanaerobaculia bacterium]|nr:ATP-binding protein [Thermoanaerobaculia bacterium]